MFRFEKASAAVLALCLSSLVFVRLMFETLVHMTSSIELRQLILAPKIIRLNAPVYVNVQQPAHVSSPPLIILLKSALTTKLPRCLCQATSSKMEAQSQMTSSKTPNTKSTTNQAPHLSWSGMSNRRRAPPPPPTATASPRS